MSIQLKTKASIKTCLAFICFLFLSTPLLAQTPTLKPLDGSPISFDQLQGKWVLINFWASWCGPCVEEIKTLNAFYKQYQSQIALYAVNMDEGSPQEQRELAKSFHLSYPSLDADTTTLWVDKPISAVPATFIYSPSGKLFNVLYGQLSMSHLTKIIEQTKRA